MGLSKKLYSPELFFYCISLKTHLNEAVVSIDGVLQIWIVHMLWDYTEIQAVHCHT